MIVRMGTRVMRHFDGAVGEVAFNFDIDRTGMEIEVDWFDLSLGRTREVWVCDVRPYAYRPNVYRAIKWRDEKRNPIKTFSRVHQVGHMLTP